MLKTISINACSKYIKLMQDCTDEHINKLELNQEIDFSTVLQKISMDIITKIFFGQDIKDKVEL